MTCQKTLQVPVRIEGTGLHSGLPSRVTLLPGKPNSGVWLKRLDRVPEVAFRATWENLDPNLSGGRQTSLRHGEIRVRTVEHLLAAFLGLGVDNAVVEIEGEELPGLDGSAQVYAEKILEAGLVDQPERRQYLEVDQPIYLRGDDFTMTVLPSNNFEISYTLSYGSEALGDQFVRFRVTPESFARQIAPARTFCLKEEAEALLASGYGQGASLNNTLVFEGGEPIGNVLRFPDEAARHKVLDLIGDLFLLGRPIRGHVISFRTGHRQNHELVRKLLEWDQEKSQGARESMNPPERKKQLDVKDIQAILPHRYPFLLVDRILHLEPGKKASGIKNVTVDDYYFQGHFPGLPVMPGVLIIEALAQVGGVVMLSKSENRGKIAYLMSIDNAKFRQPVVPGDQLRLEAEVLKSRSKTGQCAGRAYVGDKLVCEAQVKFAVLARGEEPSKVEE